MIDSSWNNLAGVVIGLGSIGNRHLNNLRKLGLTRLAVVRRPKSNAHFSLPDGVKEFHSLDEALAIKPDFAIVCNPSAMHVETAIRLLEAKVHTLIEKPLSHSFGESEAKLVELAKKSDRVCAMAYCMRYHPAYRNAHEAIAGGVIGRVIYAKAWFEGYLPDWHPWEDYRQSYAALPEQGGGVLRTLDHEMDFLQWTLGPSESISGFAQNTGALGIMADDVAMYGMLHSSGVLSQVSVAFCRKPASRGFEFVGDKGVICFRMDEGALRLYRRDDVEPQLLASLAGYDMNQMYVDLVNDFLSEISDRSMLRLPHLDAGVDCLRNFEKLPMSANSRI